MGSMRTHQLPTFVRGDARLYLGIIAKQKTLDSNWKQTDGDVSRTYGRSKGDCEAETLRILGEELDALAQKKKLQLKHGRTCCRTAELHSKIYSAIWIDCGEG